MKVNHILSVQGYHVIEDVEKCGMEIAEYLNDHSNWPQPIFPDEADCSQLETIPPYFHTSETMWICDNGTEGRPRLCEKKT